MPDPTVLISSFFGLLRMLRFQLAHLSACFPAGDLFVTVSRVERGWAGQGWAGLAWARLVWSGLVWQGQQYHWCNCKYTTIHHKSVHHKFLYL